MRVKLLKLELQDGSKVKATADIQLGSLLVIRGVKLVRVDSGRLVVYMPSYPEGKKYFAAVECFGGDRDSAPWGLPQAGTGQQKREKQVTKSADARNPLLNQGFRASCCFRKGEITMDMTQPKALFDLLYSVIIGIIGMAGVLYGGYSSRDGFTNDQPESKKKGITIILVTVFVIIFLFAAKNLILGMVGIE